MRLQWFRSALACVVAVLLGAAIWHYSPRVTGHAEPWDSPTPYYLVALFVAGVAAGAVDPRRFWLAPTGVYVGQFAYMAAFLPGGSLMILGMVFMVGATIASLAGAALTFWIWLLWRKAAARRTVARGAGNGGGPV